MSYIPPTLEQRIAAAGGLQPYLTAMGINYEMFTSFLAIKPHLPDTVIARLLSNEGGTTIGRHKVGKLRKIYAKEKM